MWIAPRTMCSRPPHGGLPTSNLFTGLEAPAAIAGLRILRYPSDGSTPQFIDEEGGSVKMLAPGLWEVTATHTSAFAGIEHTPDPSPSPPATSPSPSPSPAVGAPDDYTGAPVIISAAPAAALPWPLLLSAGLGLLRFVVL